jgi:hypothetical protein
MVKSGILKTGSFTGKRKRSAKLKTHLLEEEVKVEQSKEK